MPLLVSHARLFADAKTSRGHPGWASRSVSSARSADDGDQNFILVTHQSLGTGHDPHPRRRGGRSGGTGCPRRSSGSGFALLPARACRALWAGLASFAGRPGWALRARCALRPLWPDLPLRPGWTDLAARAPGSLRSDLSLRTFAALRPGWARGACGPDRARRPLRAGLALLSWLGLATRCKRNCH